MMDAGAWRRADGGIVAGEVAEGVTLVKNARVEVRDGTRLAADLYLPTAALEQAAAGLGRHGVHPVPQGRGRPGLALLPVPRRSRATPSRASTSAAPAPRRA